MLSKSFKLIIYFLLTGTIATSCASLVFGLLNVDEKHAREVLVSNGKKQLVFIPLHHIGKRSYYNDIQNKFDSLLALNYIVFYESVNRASGIDSLQIDTLYRKARNISGVDFVSMIKHGGYIDTTTNSFSGKYSRYISRQQLINQPKSLVKRGDTIQFRRIDSDVTGLVRATEKKYGQVFLMEKDLNTDFGKRYGPIENKERRQYFLEEFRNRLITDSILASPNNKIALLYGEKHIKGIIRMLQAADSNYKVVERF